MADLKCQSDAINKRKVLLRSDAVVGDDDNKLKPSSRGIISLKKHSSRSKDSYTDISGIDLFQFISSTLHKNEKDREFLLRIEGELRGFVADESSPYHVFPIMSSYNRMLLHRVAAFFGLLHNVDQTGQQVVVTKYKGHTRLPDIEFRSLIKHSNYTDEKFLLKRNVQSFDETNLPSNGKNSSLHHFRSRFHTTIWNDELNRGRRARSFEMGDWYNGAGGFQQHAQSKCRQNSSTFDYACETMSSNCSSSASSSAISAQMQAIHIPVYSYQPCVPFTATEPSLISPSNASTYSESINSSQIAPMVSMQHHGGKTLQGAGAPFQLREVEPECNIQQQQRQPNIPSLFSIQSTPPQIYPATNQQVYSNQYSTFYRYQPIHRQPLLINEIDAPIQYTSPTFCYCYSPNYYPMCQPQAIVQPHPLLEYNCTRHIDEQICPANIASESKPELELDESDAIVPKNNQPDLEEERNIEGQLSAKVSR